MQRDHLFEKHRLGARDILDGLARHRFGKETNKIAGVTRLHGDADLAVGLKAANTRTVARARIDDDKRPSRRIDLDARGRHNPHQGVVDRPIKPAAVDDKLGFVVEDVRNSFRLVFAILIAALPHHVQKQHASLRGIDEIVYRRTEQTKRRQDWITRRRRRDGWKFRHYRFPSLGVGTGQKTATSRRQ